MFDFSLQGVQTVKPSVLEETFNNVGEGFEDILNTLEQIRGHGDMSAVDALQLQQDVFRYSMFQEVVSKIASKSATAINEVMKAQ
ncbi:type III secretion system inner rod subunit SctI [Vibrio parahaemolyticus]|uniref:type III secretion system inner rod subunit SctI n=1 Tax=Vibrio parahaemolyticus TaxID=670 RepID=UPI00035921EE|nr:type III secretion system inner rod subunit SctI [Vibrio parahaemolyticus]AGQ92504.1 type III secretion apparatus protein, YscI/HrpB family [Vibrio parahaemolyticus O1:Kuk str. FDA_R31]EGQ7665339.1 EscI/YscI/HrpB family type III secretion system inner rod protein [Vibrio parahaemolyticus]EGQ7683561.1 EscI/YscI/HrpB family type III secretion system inner rod protein [Vibrio parahaemolyticus]EGQ7830761.1 EscI/YscI/HrpB family type III secretion system inner rod protein [Vibrio parahaemolyticus